MSGRPLAIANLLIRYTPVMTRLRRMPVFGSLVHFVAGATIPREALVWSCVELGPVRDLWIALNPRTGTTTLPCENSIELQTLLEQLRGDMTFYDLGANFGCYSLLAASMVSSRGAVFSFEPDL